MAHENLCDLFFEFSNEDRLKMLYRLREKPSTVTAISKDLGLTTQEASRHLTRLGEMGLTVKGPSGGHSLTPYGELSLAQLKGFNFTCRHSGYFAAHDVARLPAQFVARLGELDGCVYVDDVMVIFHRIEKAIKEAEEYVWRLTDRYIITAIPVWEDALRRGVEFRLLEPRDIVIPQEFTQGPVLAAALVSGQFRNNVVERVDVFMAVTEKEVAGICFPELNGKMDYRGFASDDLEAQDWARDLYEYYWGRSTVKQRRSV
jgi:predicted transcriptional regulator